MRINKWTYLEQMKWRKSFFVVIAINWRIYSKCIINIFSCVSISMIKGVCSIERNCCVRVFNCSCTQLQCEYFDASLHRCIYHHYCSYFYHFLFYTVHIVFFLSLSIWFLFMVKKFSSCFSCFSYYFLSFRCRVHYYCMVCVCVWNCKYSFCDSVWFSARLQTLNVLSLPVFSIACTLNIIWRMKWCSRMSTIFLFLFYIYYFSAIFEFCLALPVCVRACVFPKWKVNMIYVYLWAVMHLEAEKEKNLHYSTALTPPANYHIHWDVYLFNDYSMLHK